MDIIHHFNYGNAVMNICRSTGFKEKMFRGDFFCHYSDKDGNFIMSEDTCTNIKEEDIPMCIKYCKFIEQCLDDYQNSGKKKDDYYSTGLGRYDFRLLNENKYEITNPDSVSRHENLRFVQFYFKEKFKYNYYSRMEIEWSNKTDEELITIEGLYPEKCYWDPIHIQGKQYDGFSLHSHIYYEIGYWLSHSDNPYWCYSPNSHCIHR